MQHAARALAAGGTRLSFRIRAGVRWTAASAVSVAGWWCASEWPLAVLFGQAGFCRGADVFSKALALGSARRVLGRLYMWGLAWPAKKA